MRHFLLFTCLLMFVAGCAYPASSVKVSDDRPTIAIKGAPENAMLKVDGLEMGLANQFDVHSQLLIVEPGTHMIEIIYQNSRIHSEKVFLGVGETRVIEVIFNGGAEE